MKTITIAVVAFLATTCAASAATVDLSPITEPLIQAAGAVLTGLVGWTLWAARSWLSTKVDLSKTEMDDILAQNLKEAAHRGIDYAMQMSKEKLGKGGALSTVNVDNQFIKMGADYVIRSYAGTIAKLGITPQHVEDMIRARLPMHSDTGIIRTAMIKR